MGKVFSRTIWLLKRRTGENQSQLTASVAEDISVLGRSG